MPDAHAPHSTDQYDAAGQLFVGDISPTRPDITIVDLVRGAAIGTLDDHSGPSPHRVAIVVAPSGRLVATLRGEDPPPPFRDPTTGALVELPRRRGQILVWDTGTRAIVGRVDDDAAEPILGFAFSADEQSLMIATTWGLERRAFDGRRITAWAIPGLRVFTAVPSRPGTWMLAVETARRPTYALLDETGRRPRTLRLRGIRSVTRMRVSPDGRWLAVGTWDAGFELWDLTARRAPVLRSDEWINDLAFSADSRTLAASIGLGCGPREHVVTVDLATARVVLDLVLDARSVHHAGHELFVGMLLSVERIDLATGRVTPIVTHDCPTCGIRLCG